MKKLFSLLIVLIFCVFYYCNVNKDPITPTLVNQSSGLLSFIDYHCMGEPEGLGKSLSSQVYIMDHIMNQDTLTMRIHYEANCCPAFVNEAIVTEGKIVINIADTLRNCKCMCTFENDYKFLYSYTGDLRVVFQWWDIAHENLTTYMDTTIVIK